MNPFITTVDYVFTTIDAIVIPSESAFAEPDFPVEADSPGGINFNCVIA